MAWCARVLSSSTWESETKTSLFNKGRLSAYIHLHGTTSFQTNTLIIGSKSICRHRRMNRIGLLLIFRRLTYAVHFLPFSFIGVLAIKSKGLSWEKKLPDGGRLWERSLQLSCINPSLLWHWMVPLTLLDLTVWKSPTLSIWFLCIPALARISFFFLNTVGPPVKHHFSH